MRIVVNDVAATPESGGVYSILEDFYNSIIKSNDKNEWFFILSGKYFKETPTVRIIVRKDLKKYKIKKFFFELFAGHRFINNLNPDVYISLQNIATCGIKADKQIVYLHQPIPFQKEKEFSFFKKGEKKLAFYQKIVGRFIKYTLHKVQPKIIVQTQWMKEAVIDQCKVTPNIILVSHPRVPRNGKTIFNGKGDKFFYPASNFMYKNHQLIFDAINDLNDNNYKFKVDFTLNKSQLPFRSEHIKYIGHISRHQVMDMYKEYVLIFPSYIESFGLPLIEAAISADIILAADTTFSRELLKNYNNVYFYPYNDDKKLAKLIKKVINKDIISNHKSLDLIDNGEDLIATIRKCLN
ncbi:MAG TPA: glycosyltransferase [Candidatus Dwaynia gallinarum]|nr:glycosyltransferase [Candidatus Dwaynia gallinarum]